MPDDETKTNDNTNTSTGDNKGNSGETKPADKEYNFRQLEEARNKEKERADKLLQSTVETLGKSAGLDPSKGYHKLLIKEYASGLSADDVPTEESFQNFLTEQGFEPGTQPTTQEQNLDNLQNVSEQLRSGTTEQTPSDTKDLIQKAESEGRWEDAIGIKLMQQVGEE